MPTNFYLCFTKLIFGFLYPGKYRTSVRGNITVSFFRFLAGLAGIGIKSESARLLLHINVIGINCRQLFLNTGRVHLSELFISHGLPDQIRSDNGSEFRDALLNKEIFDTILEARVITEQWRNHYNTKQPHSSLNFQPPVP